jgi:hypothetical protein
MKRNSVTFTDVLTTVIVILICVGTIFGIISYAKDYYRTEKVYATITGLDRIVTDSGSFWIVLTDKGPFANMDNGI